MMTGKAFRAWVLTCVRDDSVVAIDDGGTTILAAGSVEELQGGSGLVEMLEVDRVPAPASATPSGRASHAFRVESDK